MALPLPDLSNVNVSNPSNNDLGWFKSIIQSQLFRPSKEEKPFPAGIVAKCVTVSGIDAVMYPSATRSQALIFFHSNAGNITWYGERLKSLKIKYPNYDIWTFDYPGYGRTPGVSTPESLVESGYTFLTHIQKNYKNWMWVGDSLGAAVVLGVLNKYHKTFSYLPNEVVLINPFASIADIARRKVSGADKIVNMLGFEIPVKHWASAVVKVCPSIKWSVHYSQIDEEVPQEHVMLIAKELNIVPIQMTGSHYDYVF